VHLPIGFLVVLALFELLARPANRQQLTDASRVVLAVTFPVTLASIVCGWLLASSGEFDGSKLFWHRWLGTTLGVATLLLLGLHWAGMFRLYRWGLSCTLALLVAASHFGGSLTHGNGYLSWPKSRSSGSKPSSTGKLLEQPVYATAVEPVLSKYCVSCHGPDKAKGGLRLDTMEHLLKGGDNGSVVSPPGATHSPLGKRLALPVDDDDHMPPDGKPQLSEAQLAVINWWLDAGTPTDKTVQDLQPTPEMLKLIEALVSAGTPVSDPAL